MGAVRRRSTSPATSLDGQVAKVADFGVFVRLPVGLEGLMHVSETDVPRGEKPSDQFLEEGDPIAREDPADRAGGAADRPLVARRRTARSRRRSTGRGDPRSRLGKAGAGGLGVRRVEGTA